MRIDLPHTHGQRLHECFRPRASDRRDAVHIREATAGDFQEIWPIFHEIVAAGETYAYPRGTSKDEAERLWMLLPRKTFVAEEASQVLGTYFIKTNHDGPGSHVCNCGYMVSSRARGRGLATSMCVHSQRMAIALGYKAMQFNLVATSNDVAAGLWKKLGFDVVGRLPRAFDHPAQGYVDALVMYKWLGTRQDAAPDEDLAS